ncbi:MAG: sigma-54-dependent Fis family transcriptional regulator [Deltaproteobacteria bacterium]|nr:sigma-54-dependent Fis family transcriptional regulator [Deltaproteobacteria bacterium]
MDAKILIIDDDQDMCELLERRLREWGFQSKWKNSSKEALQLLLAENFDAVVTDLNMSDINGIDFCKRVEENRPGLPVVVITAFGSMETAIAAIRAGAYDFITKPLDVETLALTLERAVRHHSLKEEVKHLRDVVALSTPFDDKIIGASTAMKKVYHLLERMADKQTSVLIVGETGTGKELVARALHRRGRRRDKPFVAVNCAALPEHLLENEFFGHAKGAFTDARSAKPGILVQASGGTVFLDEIGELPLKLQPKLLRALQERCVRPVGGTSEVSFDIRLVTATNRDLEEDVQQKRFRADLLYRINVVQINVPQLSSRGNDILLLAQHFIEVFAKKTNRNIEGLTSSAAKKLLSYFWPGNVRELQNCMERAVALTEYERIIVDDLPERIRNYRTSHVVEASSDPSKLQAMHEVERRYILKVLDVVGGNKAHAARVLGFDRRTLYRKLKQYGM